jgi:6-phosphogluconate dehydrogenase
MQFSPHEPCNAPERFIALIPKVCTRTELTSFEGRVSDSGEGRWTLQAAIDEGVPAPVISAALFGRFESRGLAEYADKLLSAMRYEFGGHIEKTASEGTP